jgi:hypothetical protein
MKNKQIEALCMALLKADSESDVVKILTDEGYWNDPSVWRDYGDREGNFSTIGSQQSKPESALVEKVINCVDSRLMNACLMAGIDPCSPSAPPDILSAVAQFFPGTSGSLSEWAAKTRRDEAKYISIAVTGEKKRPCITISDQGEGQTPGRVPDTFMSIDKSNKLRIPFVQGKFNMGGTGVLRFCGDEHCQLIITRRNPKILTGPEQADESAGMWSFTITRRVLPPQTVGGVRNSVFKYLAPVGADQSPNKGRVLCFSADSLPLMPEHNEAYTRGVEHGTAIKLYNYDMKGFSSHVHMKDGLLYRLEALMPELALPVNLHECRAYGGKKKGSFVTSLAGLTVRLEDGKGGNIEHGFPDSVPFRVGGEDMTAKIYAFKDGKAETYTTNEGIIFTINGQTHGYLPKSIFSRNRVRLGRLKDSLLVTVDCSAIGVNARENLFMNSRDRLSNHQLRKDVEAELEEILSQHLALKKLANERKELDINDRLANTKPLEEVLQSIFKSSPSLNALFRTGQRLSSPHNKQSGRDNGNGTGSKNGNGDGPGLAPFAGKPHPTFFRFRKKKDGEILVRNCEHGRRCRITFETDVENEYFTRTSMPGYYDVEVIDGNGRWSTPPDIQSSMILHDGLAHWSVQIPDEVAIGDTLTLQVTVADPVYSDGITNVAKLTVQPQAERPGGAGRNRNSSTSGGIGEAPAGVEMPNIVYVREDGWAEHRFNEKSACEATQETDGTHTFYINVDNIYLKHEMKSRNEAPRLLEAKFVYGNVLIGLALLQEDKAKTHGKEANATDSENTEAASVEQRIQEVTFALSPFIVPMINYLGALSEEEVVYFGQAGDEE